MLHFISEVLQYPFLQYALAAGLLSAVACGSIGPFVAARRITFIAGGIAHSVLAGLGGALYLNRVHGWTWLEPMHGAVVAALGTAALIALVSLKAREKEDTLIGALWAVGMAAGVLFIYATPGYNQNLMSYLFGNILMVAPADLTRLLIMDIVVAGTTIALYNRFLAICFDEEFARSRGINVELYYVILLGLTALAVVALVSVVGIVMVIALLTLPVATSAQFTRVLWKQMVLTTLVSGCLTTGGLWLSYGPDLPAGATIVMLAGVTYLAVLTVKKLLRGRLLLQQAAREGSGAPDEDHRI